MELQFQKTVCRCMVPVLHDVRSQEQTQEVKLTEPLPDVGEILGSWGQCLLRSKEWRGKSLGISGGIMTWTLYLPEDGTGPVCVEAWVPFQMKWEIPETQREGMIRTACMVSNVEARTVSARRILIRTNVTVWVEALEPGERELPVPGEMPEDIQMLRRSYPLRISREAGEKPFSMEEELLLSENRDEVEKILAYHFSPAILEKKIVGERLVFRGNGLLHMVYQNRAGRICVWDAELPFSQLTELEMEYGPEGEADIRCAVTNVDLEKTDDKILLKCGMTAQYVIRGRQTVELVQDAYSNRRKVDITPGELNLPTILDQRQEVCHMEVELHAEPATPVDAVFYLEKPEVQREESEVRIELEGTAQVWYYDRDNHLQCAMQRFSERKEIAASPDTELQIVVAQGMTPQIGLTGTGIRISGGTTLDITAQGSHGIPMVAGFQAGEPESPNPNRPSLILRRAGGEPLWEMAKHCGSTVEAIRGANQIQEEPEKGQVLLIPIP